MERSYDVAVTALTIQAQIKWVDNLLSRHRIVGVEQASQGTTRRVSPSGMIRVAVVHLLVDTLGLSVARAVSVAERICASPAHAADLGEGTGAITIDIPRLERQLAARLADAVESAPRRTRGRPPARPRLRRDGME